MSGRDFRTRHMLINLIIKGLSATADGVGGSRLTELQPETVGTAFSAILFSENSGVCPAASYNRGAAGTARTELQPETIRKAFSAILFPQERQNMPHSIVWQGCSRNCPDRNATRDNRHGIKRNSVFKGIAGICTVAWVVGIQSERLQQICGWKQQEQL